MAYLGYLLGVHFKHYMQPAEKFFSLFLSIQYRNLLNLHRFLIANVTLSCPSVYNLSVYKETGHHQIYYHADEQNNSVF
jgi:hypothetical protein